MVAETTTAQKKPHVAKEAPAPKKDIKEKESKKGKPLVLELLGVETRIRLDKSVLTRRIRHLQAIIDENEMEPALIKKARSQLQWHKRKLRNMDPDTSNNK